MTPQHLAPPQKLPTLGVGPLLFINPRLFVIPSVRWAFGPPKEMKNTSLLQPLSMEPLPLPCHPDRSEAKRRDLRFRGPFDEMFFDGAKPTCPGVPWRNLLCAIRVPRIYRSTTTFPLSSRARVSAKA